MEIEGYGHQKLDSNIYTSYSNKSPRCIEVNYSSVFYPIYCRMAWYRLSPPPKKKTKEKNMTTTTTTQKMGGPATFMTKPVDF